MFANPPPLLPGHAAYPYVFDDREAPPFVPILKHFPRQPRTPAVEFHAYARRYRAKHAWKDDHR